MADEKKTRRPNGGMLTQQTKGAPLGALIFIALALAGCNNATETSCAVLCTPGFHQDPNGCTCVADDDAGPPPLDTTVDAMSEPEAAADGAAAEADGGSDEPEPACNPCHDCSPDELGRPRYCDDRGVCRLDQVCSVPNPPFDAGDPRCAPWDAVGVGDACSAILGWAYDGSRCYRVIGCTCEGADCGHLYNDALPCGFDHGLCPHGQSDGGAADAGGE